MSSLSLPRRVLSSLLLTIMLLPAVHGQTRFFTDDQGVTFNTTGAPVIVTPAMHGAVSLYHFGLPAEQVLAVFGLWFVRGSNLDVTDLSNRADHYFPDIDPSAEDLANLGLTLNLSPSCFNNPVNCPDSGIEVQEFLQLTGYDFVIYIGNGNLGQTLANFVSLFPAGIEIIFIDTSFETGTDCRDDVYQTVNENCSARSVVDIINRVEELYTFLTGEEPNAAAQQDKEDACAAMSRFSSVMETAHDNGIQALPSTLSVSDDGGISIRPQEINQFMLRTFEELGMPIAHRGEEQVTFTEEDWVVGGSQARPTDVWMLDSRSFSVVQQNFDAVNQALSDPALAENQIGYWARSDGALSWRMLGPALNTISDVFESAMNVASDDATCDVVDVNSLEFANIETGLLDLDGIACFDPDSTSASLESAMCVISTSAPTTSPTATPTASPTTMAPVTLPTTPVPTEAITSAPTASPTATPTASPTTMAPVTLPTTPAPTEAITSAPTASPTVTPTSSPNMVPVTLPTTPAPMEAITSAPTSSPIATVTEAPTDAAATQEPTDSPTSITVETEAPVVTETESPVAETDAPDETATDPPVTETGAPADPETEPPVAETEVPVDTATDPPTEAPVVVVTEPPVTETEAPEAEIDMPSSPPETLAPIAVEVATSAPSIMAGTTDPPIAAEFSGDSISRSSSRYSSSSSKGKGGKGSSSLSSGKGKKDKRSKKSKSSKSHKKSKTRKSSSSGSSSSRKDSSSSSSETS